jgi:hypothetical protein
MHSFLCALWHIPEGFATLMGGLFVVIAAAIAWASVRLQVRSAERIEQTRAVNEVGAMKLGFWTELLTYVPGILQGLSIWNGRALGDPDAEVITNWPVFLDPIFYRANVGRIGLLRPQWVPGPIIGFYSNLLELNDQAREALAGRPTVNATAASVAARLRRMALNLSQALDGLVKDEKMPIPPEMRLEDCIAPDGRRVSQLSPVPTSVQALLRAVGGHG